MGLTWLMRTGWEPGISRCPPPPRLTTAPDGTGEPTPWSGLWARHAFDSNRLDRCLGLLCLSCDATLSHRSNVRDGQAATLQLPRVLTRRRVHDIIDPAPRPSAAGDSATSRRPSIVDIDATGSSHALPCFLTLESMSESQTDPRDHRREGALWMSRQRDTPQVPANGKRRAQRSVPDPCFIAVVAPRT